MPNPVAHFEITVRMDVTEIPGSVTLAQFEDPAGNVIRLLKARS